MPGCCSRPSPGAPSGSDSAPASRRSTCGSQPTSLAATLTFLDQGSIDFEGDFYNYSGVTTAARPVQEHLPLKIGAMGGPKSMELAGEIADGLHTACAYSSQALGYAVERFRAGAERADRSPESLDLGDSLLGAIAPDGEVARRAGRVMAAFYIPSMPLKRPRAAAASPGRSPG